VLAARLGAAAVDALLEGMSDVMIGEQSGQVTHVPLADTWENRKPVPHFMDELASLLV
jgi:6-phosphofructokinase 1